jgi:hypothetical protein
VTDADDELWAEKLNLREGRGSSYEGIASSHILIVFMRAAGGEDSLCMWGGGVGSAEGRSLDAALRRGSEREQEERGEGEGGDVCVCERRLRRCMASPEAFSRMYLRSASVRPGMASLTSTHRTLVGEPCGEESDMYSRGSLGL